MFPDTYTKYALPILIIGTLLLCGCMETSNLDPEGEWIILPAMEEWPDGTTGISSISDSATGDYQGLVIDTIPEYVVAGPGENISIEVVFRNKGDNPITIDNFPTAFLIKNPADISDPSRIARRYLRGHETVIIEPGDTIIYNFEWNLKDNNGFQVSPGIYTVEIIDVMYYNGETESIKRGDMGEKIAEITVQPAGEILESTIFVNESKTDEGITITLESINAKSNYTELDFSAYAANPDYVSVMPDGREWTYKLSDENMHGYYRIDNGEMKYLWNVELTDRKDSQYSYKYLIEPISRDAGNLSVIIESFGPVPGSWEYEIGF
jgi:hypothetical protein